MLKCHLVNITNNWEQTVINYLGDSEIQSGNFKIVNTFDLEVDNHDSLEHLIKNISVYLSQKITLETDGKIEWERDIIEGHICKYCFTNNGNILSNDDNEDIPINTKVLLCDNCSRGYIYDDDINKIYLPLPRSLLLFDKNKKIINQSYFTIDQENKHISTDILLPYSFQNNKYNFTPIDDEEDDNSQFNYQDYLNNAKKLLIAFNEKLNDIKYNVNLSVSLDNLGIKKEGSDASFSEIYILYYPDFNLLLDKVNISNDLKNLYSRIFWTKMDIKIYTQQLKKLDFVKTNNLMVDITRNVNENKDKIIAFMNVKYEEKEFVETDEYFQKILIRTNVDNDNTIIDLLKLFHLFILDDDIPYISMYVPTIYNKKSKILRKFNNDFEPKVNHWVNEKIGKNKIQFRVKINNTYFIVELYSTGSIDIILSFTVEENIKINEDFLKQIVLKTNNLIDRLNKTDMKFKNEINPIIINKIDNNVRQWGDINSPTEFGGISQNVVVKFIDKDNEIDVEQLINLIQCLDQFTEVIDFTDNIVKFFYVRDGNQRDAIRLDMYMWEFIKQNDMENDKNWNLLQEEVGIKFGWEGEYLENIIMRWRQINDKTLEQLKEIKEVKKQKGKNDIISFNPKIIGIYISIEKTITGINRIVIRGIKKWEQIISVNDFIIKLFYTHLNLDKFEKLRKICANVKVIKKIEKKEKKQREVINNLKQIFPEIFGFKGSLKNESYVRMCPANINRQPVIFSQKSQYEEWLDSYRSKIQINKNDKIEYIFQWNCYNLSDDDLTKELKTNKLKIPKSRLEKCYNLQNHYFLNTKWDAKELKKITETLGLKSKSKKDENIETINRYFKILKESIKNGEDNNLNPNPHTFVMKKNNNNYYLTCSNKKYPRMGFLDLNKHPMFEKEPDKNHAKKWCLPCCFNNINEPIVDFCSNRIDYSDISAGKTEISDYIVNENKFPISVNRYGLLPIKLNKLFNGTNVQQRLSEISKNVFLRIGVKQNHQSMINAIITAMKLPNFEVSDVLINIEKEIKNPINDYKFFRSLNSGSLFFKFNGDYKNVIEYLVNETVQKDENNIWDILTRPKILHEDGMNIIIFEIIDSKLYIKCPPEQEINYFFNNKKNTIFLYKNGELFEPIVQHIPPNKRMGVFKLENNEIYNYMQTWYLNTCKYSDIDIRITCKYLLNNPINFEPIGSIVNNFNKAIYIATKDKYLIPCIPSGFDINSPIISIDNKEKLNKYIHSYEETIKYLEKMSKDLPLLMPKYSVITQDEKIVAIGTSDENDTIVLVVPIIPEDVKDNILPVNREINLLDEIDYSIVNELIGNQDFIEINYKKFKREIYQRLRYLFSKKIDLNIQNIIENENKEDLTQIVLNVLKPNIIIEQLDMDSFKKYDIPPIRTLCEDENKLQCDNNLHCRSSNDMCKLVIQTEKDFNIYVKRIVDELLQFPLKRRDLLYNSVDIIIDRLNFDSTDKYIYV